MNWKTLAVLPIIAIMVWVVIAAIAFGDRLGSTWTEATTATVTNGLVMVCFGASFFGVFLISIVIGIALASRLLGKPANQQGEQRQSFMDRFHAKSAPPGWNDEPVVDSYGQPGRVVSVEAPPGLRPLAPVAPPAAIQPYGGMAFPMASGAFDAMEDGQDRRYRGE